jgi:anti-sigma factor RsiW
MSRCEHSENVGAYVLKALDEPAASEFSAHLADCQACSREVADLQVVADNLPLAAEQVSPSQAVRDRIMASVQSEAQLLQAAGARADRPATPTKRPRRRRRWMPRLVTKPAIAAMAAACALLVALLVDRSDGPHTRTFSAAAPAGAQAFVTVRNGRAELSVERMPSPAQGKVYEVWLVRAGRPPQATHALFGVRSDGRAVVKIPERVGDADAVWVTAEPPSGSVVPSGPPVIKANLT